MARILEPFCLASRCAARVSAVSPDWLMQIVSVFESMIRIAVAEFAAVVHFDGNFRQLFDHEFAGLPGVPARAAGHDLDLREFTELLARRCPFCRGTPCAAGIERHAGER